MSDEYDQLVALGAPGLSIGPCIDDDLGTWSNIEPEDHPDTIDFVRAALHEIRCLTEGEQPNAEDFGDGAPSTVSSTARSGTGVDATRSER